MHINKNLFLKALFCETYGWRARNEIGIDAGIDYETLFRTTEGKEIGMRARRCFPEGYEIRDAMIERALSETREALADPSLSVVFEAAFSREGFVARPDILIRTNGDVFELIEVKSSLNENPGHVDDMAYTAMVLELAGLSVTKSTLMLISREFRTGMKDEDLFVKLDKTEDVQKRMKEFLAEKDRIKGLILSGKVPQTPVFIECRKCEYLSQCHPDYAQEDSIFFLPRLNEKMFLELKELGITSIRKIPSDFYLNDAQSFARKGVLANGLVTTSSLAKTLAQVQWPVYYLDFESISTALPLYPETAPYEKIPTQFSVHYSESMGAELAHFEYLADSRRDCREEIADELIRALGESGTIFSYSAFEKTILNGLMGKFPQKKQKLKKIMERIVDLQKIVECTYHPRYYGSYSIKKVLPALIPSLSYDDLEINNGSAAMCVFALMIQNKIDAGLEKEIRQKLLLYCERDTYAMVKLHEVLFSL